MYHNNTQVQLISFASINRAALNWTVNFVDVKCLRHSFCSVWYYYNGQAAADATIQLCRLDSQEMFCIWWIYVALIHLTEQWHAVDGKVYYLSSLLSREQAHSQSDVERIELISDVVHDAYMACIDICTYHPGA